MGTSTRQPRAKRTARPRRRTLLPEDYLERALRAKTPNARNNWAGRGLAFDGELDPTTQALLLRQRYLAHYALSEFDIAYQMATQAAELGVLVDVLHQDAARAKQALGDIDGAVLHLRLAARIGPPSRRAFHWWTVGALLFLARRHDQAIEALQRAARWGTRDKPLYQGHLALAKCRAGKRVSDIDGLIDRLAACPAGRGYGRFVLGQLAYENLRYDDARRYLAAFVERTDESQLPMKIALQGEVAMARDTLAAISGG